MPSANSLESTIWKPSGVTDADHNLQFALKAAASLVQSGTEQGWLPCFGSKWPSAGKIRLKRKGQALRKAILDAGRNRLLPKWLDLCPTIRCLRLIVVERLRLTVNRQPSTKRTQSLRARNAKSRAPTASIMLRRTNSGTEANAWNGCSARLVVVLTIMNQEIEF